MSGRGRVETVRVLALDLGTRRVGVAVSDAGGVLASPRTVIERAGDRAADHRRVADLVAEEDAEMVLVGVPYSLSGDVGPAARAALEEVDQLRSHLDVPVEVVDERFTTVEADRALRATGADGRARRRRIDQAAAAVMLQAWLDRR